jgi:hypothetical protein
MESVKLWLQIVGVVHIVLEVGDHAPWGTGQQLSCYAF